MNNLKMDDISKYLISIYNVELEKILLNISDEYNIDKDELFGKYIQNNNCSLPSKPYLKKNKNISTICIARKQDGNQCTRRKKGLSDYCGKHIKNNKCGRVDDHSNIVDKLANDDNYIMTWVETINGIDYLVDSDNIIYTNDVNSPIIVGKKNTDGNIDLIDNNPLSI